MLKFKNQLAQKLSSAVQTVFQNAKLVQVEMTEEGFYCDYDLEHSIDPESFLAISQLMKNSCVEYFYELDHFSGAYEDGDPKNKMLQRIYVIAFDSKDKLMSFKTLISEAASRDHKILGAQMKLFSSTNDIGQGLILWHPKGAMLRSLLEQFGQRAHILNDYQWVYTPHIGKAELWRTSGHLDFYKDSMYRPIVIDEEEYFLKPMNCPFHINIYNSETRSYRDLPFRLAEYGTVYRYELSGALSGLTRVRGFTQDDAHIICTEDQIESEVANALKFSLYILRSFGFEDFDAYVSTKPKAKFIGNDEQWNMATDVLKKAVLSSELEYKIDKGGGAFYGPKIDLKLKDSLNREWQCSTIQFDFNLPARFQMTYVGSDGKKHLPFMVHRALFGSFERFIALLIEHYKGEFPFWISPVQFGIVPINSVHNKYCHELVKKLKHSGYRVRINDNDANMRKKIKEFELEKIPYILVIGDKEIQNDSFSVRSRKNGNLGFMDIERLCEYLKPETEVGIPKYIFD